MVSEETLLDGVGVEPLRFRQPIRHFCQGVPFCLNGIGYRKPAVRLAHLDAYKFVPLDGGQLSLYFFLGNYLVRKPKATAKAKVIARLNAKSGIIIEFVKSGGTQIKNSTFH